MPSVTETERRRSKEMPVPHFLNSFRIVDTLAFLNFVSR